MNILNTYGHIDVEVENDAGKTLHIVLEIDGMCRSIYLKDSDDAIAFAKTLSAEEIDNADKAYAELNGFTEFKSITELNDPEVITERLEIYIDTLIKID